MEIQHEKIKKKGEFYVDEAGERVARLQYFHSREGEITVYHTEVDKKLSGQGVGRKLVAAVVDLAHTQRAKIHATCTYAHKVISESPEFKDVLV